MILDLFQSLGESTYTFHLYVIHVSSMLENSKHSSVTEIYRFMFARRKITITHFI